VYRFLLHGKWIALTVLLVLVVPLSVLAADWQWNRWQSRKTTNALVTANLVIPAAPISDITAAATSTEADWRLATVVGRYDDSLTVLVRRQVVNGRTGFIVTTPLIANDGQVVLVQRGFLPVSPSSGSVSAPPAPSGTVTVTGRIRPIPVSDLAVRPPDLPPGQVNRIDVAEFATATGLPTRDLVLAAASSTPPDSPLLTPLPLPTIDEGPHLSYVGQWTLIGIASIVIWIIVVRREASHRREEVEAAEVSRQAT